MSFSTHAPRIAAVVAALAAAGLAPFAPLLAADAGVLSAVLVLASMIRLDSDAGSGAVMSVINREIMSARRIAIYDGDTSVFAPWYIALRGIEECARSSRYGSALSVLVLQPEVDSNEWAADGWFADWLQRSTRVTDIVGNIGNGRFVVLLTETSGAGGELVIGRVASCRIPVAAGLAAYGADATTWGDLVAIATSRLAVPQGSARSTAA